jgi:ubiquinol-cytochrome c reductase iron-sulfur subunit
MGMMCEGGTMTMSMRRHQIVMTTRVDPKCAHLGCSPNGPFAPNENPQLGADAGFVCPCHGSTFDLAGRVFKDKPASDNLQIPPYRFASASMIVIGEDSKA